MRIERISVCNTLLPFISEFSISRHQGFYSNSIVVEVIADHGKIKGYGEGVPVEFITGETPKSATESIEIFTQKPFFPWELDNPSQIWNLIDHLPNGKEYNAAICACEMSLLDALGRKQKKPVIDYFSDKFFAPEVCYGATIPISNKQRITEICTMCREMQINALRVKMGKDINRNKDAIGTVRSFFEDDCDLRIDSNGSWDRYLAFRHVPLIKEYNVKIVEEPMHKNDPDFIEFAQTMQANGITLMACESAPTLNDVKRIIREGYYQMINVKLSRNGGFRRSLGIIECIRKSGLAFQIGCTIGESGILSAAGRALSLLCGDALYHDGSYDKFLLKENITKKDVSFGIGGKAGPLDGPGLGIEIDRKCLMQLSNGSPSVTISHPLS